MHDDDGPSWVLLDHAAECHFETGDSKTGQALLSELLDDNVTADFGSRNAAAEIACVYSSGTICRRALERAASALVVAVSKRELSSYSVLVFANAWRARVEQP
jgi:hypothetical protein